MVPRVDWSMDEGTFGGWLKHEGDQIKPGDYLYLLESEKASQEIESLDAGVLRIPLDSPKAGEKVRVGQLLGYLEEPAGIRPEAPAFREQALASAAEPTASIALSAASTPNPTNCPGGGVRSLPRVLISPRARRAAKRLGLDWHGLSGSGRNGRILEVDVRAAAGRESRGRLTPHTQVRRVIAARMVAGVSQAAPVTLTAEMQATNLVNLRNQFRAAASATDDIVPSYTDLIVKLVAAALRVHPLLQAQWRDAGLFVPDCIDIAIAVDTEAGLLVPVLRGVDKLTLRQVVAQARELIGRARAGSLMPAQMRHATFTITNLGSLGIDSFTPIIHLPQCAVLGIGRIVTEAVVSGDKIVACEMVTLNLTFDHRVVDGAPAARFLATLGKYLENPAPWLMP
jgi:pyruvate dehydrogenase E2 component (dihydrolipoamide acetyltransferase)